MFNSEVINAQNEPWCNPIEISPSAGFGFTYGTPAMTIVNGNPAAAYVFEDDNTDVYFVRANDNKGTSNKN